MVDIETSGLNPNYHDVIEVGMCDGTGETRAFSLPFNVFQASDKALEVNGWGKRAFAPEVGIPSGLAVIRDFVRDDFIVAAPAHFDIGFLEALHRRWDQPIPWGHRRVIDMKSFYQGIVQGVVGVVEASNNDIAKYTGVDPLPPEEQHSALNDAVWQAELFRRLIHLSTL